jgi:hypothetical protein
MKLTVFGIGVLSVGTYFTFTEKGKVLGVVLIALGTLFMYLGQRRDSMVDSRRLEAKVAEIRREITEAKALPAPRAAQKLKQIDRDFAQWASTFEKEKEHRKLEAEETRLADRKAQLDNSAIWRPVLEFFLSTASGALQAYAAETKRSVVVQLPKLPANLYDATTRNSGTIMLRKDASWEIAIADPGLSDFPIMRVRLRRVGRLDSLLQVWSIGDSAFVQLTVYKGIIANLPGMDGSFPRDNWQDGFKKAIMRLVEAQILALEGHPH